MMKRMVLAGMLVAGAMMVPVRAQAVAAAGEPQAKDDLFAGTEQFAKNASDATEVTMDPQSLGMVEGSNKSKARGMKLSVVRTYSYDKPGMYNLADVEVYRAKLMTGDWHCSVHVRSMKTGESTDVCYKARTDDMVESATIVVEPKSLTFIHTIKQKRQDGSWSQGNAYGNDSALGAWPLTFDPEMQARMTVMGAEMKAQMAAVQPELLASMAELKAEAATWDVEGLKVELSGLKSMKLPHAEALKRQARDLRRQLDETKPNVQHQVDPQQPEY